MTKLIAGFSLDDAQKAAEEWGANCGPGAIAAVLDSTLEAIRPNLGDFEKKHYTNPTLMYQILNNLKVKWQLITDHLRWPKNGLVRVQWLGPWTEPGQHWAARQRHTHWVASRWLDHDIYIFDINCICVGGWVPVTEWELQVAPWLIKSVEPLGYGTWYPTHNIEIGQHS